MIEKQEETYWVKIEIAGDIHIIKQSCREFCWEGCCVRIIPVDFIYTGGEEAGASIMLVNYPRFPQTKQEVWEQAKRIALKLRKDAHQWSVMLMAPDKTEWITTREEKQ